MNIIIRWSILGVNEFLIAIGALWTEYCPNRRVEDKKVLIISIISDIIILKITWWEYHEQ